MDTMRKEKENQFTVEANELAVSHWGLCTVVLPRVATTVEYVAKNDSRQL